MPEIRYTFTASGEDSVNRAFESIGKSADRSASKSKQAFKKQRTAAKQSAKAQTSIAVTAAKAQQRAAAQALKAQGRDDMRAAKQRATRRERIAARSQRTMARMRLRDLKKQEMAVKRSNRNLRKSRARMGAAGLRGGRAAIRGVGAAGTAVGLVAGAATSQAISNRDKANRLSIKGGYNNGKSGQKYSQQDITDRAKEVTDSVRGSKSTDVLDAVGAFVAKTGDLEKGLGFAEEFAKIGLATGTDLQAIGAAAADLTEKFGITEIEDMADALATLTVQGKQGAFELEDAASQFPKIAAAARNFGLGGKKGLAQLGGLTQIARSGTGSPEQAATAVTALFSQITAKSEQIKKKAGVEVFSDPGVGDKARDIQTLLPEIIAGVGGDLRKLGQIFPKLSIKAISPLIGAFNDSARLVRDAGGTEKQAREAGAAAVTAALAKSINVTNARAEVERDAAQAAELTSTRISSAWETVVSSIGDQLAPKIGEFADKFSEFIETTDFSTLTTALGDIASAGGAVAEFFDLFPKKQPDPAAELQKTRNKLNKMGGGLSEKERVVFDQALAGGAGGDPKKNKQLLSDLSKGGGGSGPFMDTADVGGSAGKFERYRKLKLEEKRLAGSYEGIDNPNESLTPDSFRDRFVKAGLKGGGDPKELAEQARRFAGQAIEGGGAGDAARKGVLTQAGGIIRDKVGGFSPEMQSLVEKLMATQAARKSGVEEGGAFTQDDVAIDKSGVQKNIDGVAGAIGGLVTAINNETAKIGAKSAYF